MTNDKILMNIIEAVGLLIDSSGKNNAKERDELQNKAVRILSETNAFLKHRNPDKNH